MSTAVVEKKAHRNTIQTWINNPKMQEFVKRSLPETIDPSRLLQIYYNLISARPELQDCSAESVLRVLIFGSQLGLSFDPNLKQAWVVPFKDVATLIIGYKGIEKLAINMGSVDAIDAIPVFLDDLFEYNEGDAPGLVHRPNFSKSRDEKTYVGSYARGWKDNRVVRFKFVPKDEIDRHKDASAAVRNKKQTPWNDWYIEMANKTAIRIFGNSLPQSEKTEKFHRAINADVLADIDPQAQGRALLVEGFDDVIETTATEVVGEKKKPASRADSMADKLESKTGKKKVEEPVPADEPEEVVDVELAAKNARVARVKKLHDDFAEVVSTNKTKLEIAVSEATGGKVQSFDKIDLFTDEVIEACESYLDGRRKAATS